MTWITSSPKVVPTNHWKKLKVPALASLFDKNIPTVTDDLSTTINALRLPKGVAQAAKHETGILNARGTWRKSSREWCRENRSAVMEIIRTAAKLPANDQSRFDLAERIDILPDVKSPNRKANLPAGVLLTPLIACLDPKNRFPIVNGRKAVVSLLGKLHLAHRDLSHLRCLRSYFAGRGYEARHCRFFSEASPRTPRNLCHCDMARRNRLF